MMKSMNQAARTVVAPPVSAARRWLLPLALLVGQTVQATPSQAVSDVMALFRQTPLVAIGEAHGLNELHAFLRTLIADPAFGRTVQDIVVEFGNAKYQAVADAFVLDQRVVTLAELRQVWRNTTQSAYNTWDAPIYEQFFRAVRTANQRRPAHQAPLRVLLGDPPIDWNVVRSMQDYAAFTDRDGFYAETVLKGVLAHRHRALLLTGISHVLRSGPVTLRRSGTAAERIEAGRPGSLTVLMPYLGFPHALDQTSARLLALGSPRLLPTKTSRLGQLRAAEVFAGPPEAPLGMEDQFSEQSLAQVIDRLLLLYDPATFTRSQTDPALYKDPLYAAELRRRKRIFGIENDPRFGMAALLKLGPLRWYR